jgi:hypothetical protein
LNFKLLLFCALGLLGSSAFAQDCHGRLQDFVDRIESDLKDDAKAHTTVASAYADSQDVWKQYTEKNIANRAKQVDPNNLVGGTFDNEMDPNKSDTTNAVGKNIYDDVHILAEAIQMKQQGKSPDDLQALAVKYHLTPQNGYFTGLVRAYKDDNGNGAKLIGHTMKAMSTYNEWLKNGIQHLNEEDKRINDVYENPTDRNPTFVAQYGKNLKGDQAAVVKEFHQLVRKSADTTMAMHNAVSNMQSELSALQNSAVDCGLTDGMTKQLAGINPVNYQKPAAQPKVVNVKQ